jgi:hypothetical protein
MAIDGIYGNGSDMCIKWITKAINGSISQKEAIKTVKDLKNFFRKKYSEDYAIKQVNELIPIGSVDEDIIVWT